MPRQIDGQLGKAPPPAQLDATDQATTSTTVDGLLLGSIVRAIRVVANSAIAAANSSQQPARMLARGGHRRQDAMVAQNKAPESPHDLVLRLLEFAAPILPPRKAPLPEYAHAVRVAGGIWNLAIFVELGIDVSGQRRVFESLGLWEQSLALVRRKRAMFPGDHRQVRETHVADVGDQRHVSLVGKDFGPPDWPTARREPGASDDAPSAGASTTGSD
jgi:hypothetical protein